MKGQQVLHSLSVCVCSLRYLAFNEHAPYCHLWSTPLYNIFPHFLLNVMIFEKSYWTQNVFWFSPQLLSETFLIPRRNERDMIKMSSCKVPLILPDFNEIWIFATDFRETPKYQISWKSVQWEPSCSMRTDRWTDITKLIVYLRSFAKAPKTTFQGSVVYPYFDKCRGEWNYLVVNNEYCRMAILPFKSHAFH